MQVKHDMPTRCHPDAQSRRMTEGGWKVPVPYAHTLLRSLTLPWSECVIILLYIVSPAFNADLLC